MTTDYSFEDLDLSTAAIDDAVQGVTASKQASAQHLAQAAVEPLWPFLAASSTPLEFSHRLALSEPQMASLLAEVGTEGHGTVRDTVLQTLTERFAALHGEREAQEQAEAAREAVAVSLRATLAGADVVSQMNAAPVGAEYTIHVPLPAGFDANGGVPLSYHIFTKREDGRWYKGSIDQRGATPEEILAAQEKAGATGKMGGPPGPFDGGATLPGGKSGAKTAGWIDSARAVVESKGYKSVDESGKEVPEAKGMVLDMTTANMLVTLYDALSEANKAKFEAMPLTKAVDFGWKLLDKAKAKSGSKTAAGPIKWTGETHFLADYLSGKAPNGDIYEVYFNPNMNPTPCAWVNYGPKGDTGPNSGIAEGRGFKTMQEAVADAEQHAAAGSKTSATSIPTGSDKPTPHDRWGNRIGEGVEVEVDRGRQQEPDIGRVEEVGEDGKILVAFDESSAGYYPADKLTVISAKTAVSETEIGYLGEPDEEGFVTSFGKMRNVRATIRTTNGGEYTATITFCEGSTYPLDSVMDDGHFIGLPGWRVKSIRVEEPKTASMQKGAPFAGYEDFAACVAANSDKDDPEAYCGSIKHKVEDSKKTSAVEALRQAYRVTGQWHETGDGRVSYVEKGLGEADVFVTVPASPVRPGRWGWEVVLYDDPVHYPYGEADSQDEAMSAALEALHRVPVLASRKSAVQVLAEQGATEEDVLEAEAILSEGAFFHHPGTENAASPYPEVDRLRAERGEEREDDSEERKRHKQYWDAHPEEFERHVQQNASKHEAVGQYGGGEVPTELAEAAAKHWFGERGRVEPDHIHQSRTAPDGGSYTIEGTRISGGGEWAILYANTKPSQWSPEPFHIEFYDGSGGGIEPTEGGGWTYTGMGGPSHFAKKAVNESAQGTERYQPQPNLTGTHWPDEWEDGKAPQSYLDQGRAAHEPTNPFADRLVTVREAALRMVAADPAKPSNLEGYEEGNDWDAPVQQPLTTRPRVIPNEHREPSMVNPPGADPVPGLDPTVPTVAQLVAARVQRLAARVKVDNPSMSDEEARHIAAQTVATYPEMVKG